MNTEELIGRLATNVAPVRPLTRPGRRAALWLTAASVYIAVLVALMLAPGAAVVDPDLLLPQAAAIVTGILATLAAFASVVPGHAKHSFVWVPIAALAWLGTLLDGGFETAATSVVAAQHEWVCVAMIVIGGAPLLAAITFMLRRGAPLNPALTAALAATAVGTLANVGACASLPHANKSIMLVWHGAAILALVVAFVAMARFTFAWHTAGRFSR